MLHKAWPSELEKDSKLNDNEKDVILLKHLLNWPTWQGFLKFFGKIQTNVGPDFLVIAYFSLSLLCEILIYSKILRS